MADQPVSQGFFAQVGRVFNFDLDVFEDVATSGNVVAACAVAGVAVSSTGSIFSLVLFWIVIPATLVVLVVQAFFVRLAAPVVGGRKREFGEWYKALCFAQAPLVLGIVPFLGFVGALYALATQIGAVVRIAEVTVLKAFLVGFVALMIAFGFVVGIPVLILGPAALMGMLGVAQ